MLQITVDGFYRRPSVLDVDTQHRIKELATQNRIDILLDVHGRDVPAIAGQATGSHHAPESFFLHEQARLLGQGVSDTVVLMSGMYHDVRNVKRRPFGIVIEERTTSGQNIPGVIKVKVRHAQPKGKMNTGNGIAAIDGSELALREDLSVILEFFERVGFLGGVNQPANLNNGLVIPRLNETDSIVGWKHGDSYPGAHRRAIGWVQRAERQDGPDAGGAGE
jgi:hypothetical protein